MMDHLASWRRSERRKPLLMRGARQVGKTWLMRAFGASEYDNVAYVDCQNNPSVTALFDGEFNAARIIRGLSIAAQERIEPGSTLLILDEVQDIPAAITSLKYFEEQLGNIHVAAAGSLLGVALQRAGSFPVGKVQFLDLHPMDFLEFLDATGNDQIRALIADRDWPLIATFHERLVELVRLYMFVGGMPEAVSAFSQDAPLDDVRTIQLELARGYELDFAKHSPTSTVPGITRVWSSLPAQLARENKRFQYARVRKGARARDYEAAINWLTGAGLVHRVHRYAKPAHPVRSYEDSSIFKLFAHDVGILGAMSGLRSSALIDGLGVFEEFKGALTEQYVLQEIVAHSNEAPMYWTAQRGTAEIDFAIDQTGGLVPIEVKAAENLQSKSLRSYVEKYSPPRAIRTSLARYREEAWLTNVPLYAFSTVVADA